MTPPPLLPQDRTPESVRAFYESLCVWGRSITFQVCMVDPALATLWLGANYNNRRFKTQSVLRYARYMAAGTWNINGECVVFDVDGRLVDGQNRLAAIVKCEQAVPLCVIRGVPANAFTSLNTGATRSAADAIHIETRSAAKYENQLSSALRWLMRYETGSMECGGVFRVSNEEILDMHREFPGMRDSVEFVMQQRKRKGLYPPAPMAFLHFVCERLHPEKMEFFSKILSGTELGAQTPEHVLYMSFESNTRGKTARDTLALMAKTVKAWNAHVQGKTIKSLKWIQGESFPVIN